nr:zinc ribbon domain-containing protein [Acidobacteriota bacterium]
DAPPEPQVSQMFCPKCGQQSSDEVRFCPRCGLQLAGLAAYVASNGQTAAAAPVPRAPVMTARRRGMRRGAKLMFICAVLLPAAALLAFEDDAPGPLLLVCTAFLAGLAWLVYSWLFGDNVLPVGKGADRRDLGAAGDRPGLGAPQFAPAPLFNQQRANTGEIYQPLGVTEHTTKLLDKDS